MIWLLINLLAFSTYILFNKMYHWQLKIIAQEVKMVKQEQKRQEREHADRSNHCS